MLPELGFRINGLPRMLEFVRAIEVFEGPILTEFRALDGGGIYLEKWCANHGNVARYLITRSEQRIIAEYLSQRISMLQLLTIPSDNWGFLVDVHNNQIINTFAVRFEQLPPEYLPKADAFHDESLRPKWRTTPQNFLIDTNWDAKLLADIEKQFKNVSGFAYYTELGKGRRLPQNTFSYLYEGGFPYGHLFSSIRLSVPLEFSAKSVGVSAASPGVLTIEAPTTIVNILNKSFSSLQDSKDAYKFLHEWSKLKPANFDQVPASAFSDICNLARSLHIDHTSLFPAPTTQTVDPTASKQALLVAGKMLASYYKKLWQILKPEQRVEFISAKINAGTITAPRIVLEEDDDEDQ